VRDFRFLLNIATCGHGVNDSNLCLPQDKISAVTLKGPTPNHMEDASGLTTENDAFEGIGDDDL